MRPFVTVLIPAYNAEATIERALDSVSAQNYRSFEIVVVDDGSRDRTSEVVAGYGREEIRLLRLARNRGEGGVLNEGIAIAKGEYIAFLDADDEWLPGKLAKQIRLLEANPKATMATCGCLFADACGTIVEEFGMPPAGLAKSEIWRSLLVATSIAKPCVVARAAALARVGPFDTTIPIAADQDMWIRLAMEGEVEFLPEYLTVAHDTPGSLTKTYVKEMEGATFPMLLRHLERCKADLSRQEVRAILCERYKSVGRNLYIHGRALRGYFLLLRSLFLGAPAGETLWHLMVASPPARAAKRLFRREPEVRAKPLPGYYGGSLLAPAKRDLAAVESGPPILIASIDAEAEFDWSGPFLRTHTSVKNLSHQRLGQDVFDRFAVRPIYFVDYAVASQPEGYEPLREIADAGLCEIGAHLQAWETPPFEEELSERTSYNHNLPAWLQKEKLTRLTEAIVANFGVRPLAYRAGRYGVGEEIAWILAALGYRIDMSVRPGIDLRRLHAPDFRRATARPYWFGEDRALLEIPNTASFVGLFGSSGLAETRGMRLYDWLSRPEALKAHAPGLFARLGLLERIFLSPEGASFADMRRLTRALLARGHRVFVLSFHSSSLLPGSTQYVRSAEDLARFLGTIEAYLEFFFGEIGGQAMTPAEFRASLACADAAVPAADLLLSPAR
jgi:glycosyltransferase involved in cell wall biosynthesis